MGKIESSYRVALFEGFELDLRAGELCRQGDKPVSLAEQPFRILAMLLEHSGDLVTREEIQAALWPNGTIVEFEHSISAAINRLRQILGDSAEKPRYIETLARRGYRWKGRVEWAEKPRQSAEPAIIEAGRATADSLRSRPNREKGVPLPSAGSPRRRRNGCGVQGGRSEARTPSRTEIPARRTGERSGRPASV